MSPLAEKIETAFKKLEPLAQVHTLERLESILKNVNNTLPVATTVKIDKKSFATKWAGRFTVSRTNPRDLRMQALKKKYGLTAQ